METADIDGIKIAYHCSGSGEPIILLHGITTASFIWRKVTPSLNLNYQVITVDLLGCGDSDKSLEINYSLPSQAEHFIQEDEPELLTEAIKDFYQSNKERNDFQS